MIEEQIIDAIKERLIGADTIAEDRIYGMRWKPLADSDLPAICIYSLETSSANIENSIGEDRKAFIGVELIAKGPWTPADESESADYTINTLREEVENVLNVMYDVFNIENIRDKQYEGFKIIPDREVKEYLLLNCAMRYAFTYNFELQEAL